MNKKFLQYEIKQIKRDGWQSVSEVKALELLQDNFPEITPKIAEMLQGKEVIISKGSLRIKN